MWYDIGHWYWGWVGHGTLHFFSLLFWGLGILAVIALIKLMSGSGSTRVRSFEPGALEFLGSRYARGKMEHGEFEQKKNDQATKA